MGTYTQLTNSSTIVYIENTIYFNGFVYIAGQHTSGDMYLARLNSTEDGFDLISNLNSIGSITPNDIRFVIYNSKLYFYFATTSNGINFFRLNDTEDGVILITDNSDLSWQTDTAIFNGYLYTYFLSSTNGKSIYRLNVSGTDFDYICSSAPEYMDILTVFDSDLYLLSADSNIWKLNETETGIISICATGMFNPFCGVEYNDRLYYGGYQKLIRLNEAKDGVETIYETSDGTYARSLSIYNSRLYIHGLGTALLRLNSTEDDCENVWLNNELSVYLFSANAAISSHVYLNDFSDLYKYVSMNPVYSADPVAGFSPLDVTFSCEPYSDFTVSSYSWDFGDTESGSGQEVTHTYDIGEFDVILTLTNTAESKSYTEVDYISVVDGTIIYIHTVEELQLIDNDPSYPAYSRYELANDIDASGTVSWNGGLGFIPITIFRGEFNGAGYTISDIYINRNTSYINGTAIFHETSGAIFYNLNISNASIQNMYSVHTGVLIGIGVGGEIRNSHITATIVGGYSRTGGFCGITTGCDVIDCSFSGSITASDYNRDIGGISGYSYDSNFEDCIVNDMVVPNNIYNIGGIVGTCYNTQTFTNCTANNVDFQSLGYTGGLVGQVGGLLTVTNCTSSGVINSNNGTYLGGLIGYIYSYPVGTITDSSSSCSINHPNYSLGIGGLVGYLSSSCDMTNCYSTGDVSAITSSYVGGLIGYLGSGGTYENCYSTGEVVGRYYVGGFAGSVYGNVTINSCYTITGLLKGYFYAGGFIGTISTSNSTITECYSTRNILIDADFGNYIGGFIGYGSLGTVTDCFDKCTITITYVKSVSTLGGFVGYLYNNNDMLRCFAYCTIYAPYIREIGGFVGTGYGVGKLIQCFSMGELTGNAYMCGGLVGRCGLSMENCYSLMNLVYNGYSSGTTYRYVDCQSDTDPWCREVVASSYYGSYFNATFSTSGMDISYISTPTPDMVYITDDFPFMDMSIATKRRYKIYIDFVARGSCLDPSILSYGIFNVDPSLVCGFEIRTYRDDHSSLPEGVEIIAYNGALSSTIYSEENSFNVSFSLVYEKLGVISNFYINDILVGTIEGENQSTYAVDSLQLGFLGESDDKTTEWEISKLGFENISEYGGSGSYEINIVGGLVAYSQSGTIDKSYSVGTIEVI
jgi:hypothetical protein